MYDFEYKAKFVVLCFLKISCVKLLLIIWKTWSLRLKFGMQDNYFWSEEKTYAFNYFRENLDVANIFRIEFAIYHFEHIFFNLRIPVIFLFKTEENMKIEVGEYVRVKIITKPGYSSYAPTSIFLSKEDIFFSCTW